VQALVACNTSHPDDKVARSICRCDPGGAATGLILAPTEHERRRIRRRNFVGLDRAGVVMKSNVRSLTGVVRDSRRPAVNPRDIGLRHG